LPRAERCERPRTAFSKTVGDQPGRLAQGPEEKFGFAGRMSGIRGVFMDISHPCRWVAIRWGTVARRWFYRDEGGRSITICALVLCEIRLAGPDALGAMGERLFRRRGVPVTMDVEHPGQCGTADAAGGAGAGGVAEGCDRHGIGALQGRFDGAAPDAEAGADNRSQIGAGRLGRGAGQQRHAVDGAQLTMGKQAGRPLPAGQLPIGSRENNSCICSGYRL